jgi:hypothetical protein
VKSASSYLHRPFGRGSICRRQRRISLSAGKSGLDRIPKAAVRLSGVGVRSLVKNYQDCGDKNGG